MANAPTYRDMKQPRRVSLDTPEETAAKRASWFALPRNPRTRATNPAGVSAMLVDPKYAHRSNLEKGFCNCHGFVHRCSSLVIVDNFATCSRHERALNWSSHSPSGVRRCKECKCKSAQ